MSDMLVCRHTPPAADDTGSCTRVLQAMGRLMTLLAPVKPSHKARSPARKQGLQGTPGKTGHSALPQSSSTLCHSPPAAQSLSITAPRGFVYTATAAAHTHQGPAMNMEALKWAQQQWRQSRRRDFPGPAAACSRWQQRSPSAQPAHLPAAEYHAEAGLAAAP